MLLVHVSGSISSTDEASVTMVTLERANFKMHRSDVHFKRRLIVAHKLTFFTRELGRFQMDHLHVPVQPPLIQTLQCRKQTLKSHFNYATLVYLEVTTVTQVVAAILVNPGNVTIQRVGVGERLAAEMAGILVFSLMNVLDVSGQVSLGLQDLSANVTRITR